MINEFDNGFGTNVKGELTIDDIEKGVPLFHRPMDSRGSNPMGVINSLMKYGFSREYTGDNGGNMYGVGVYNVYSLRSSNEKATGYGRFIVKSYLLGGYQDFLIFNKDMARQVYGDDYRIEKQIEKLIPPKMAQEILSRYSLYMNDNHNCEEVRTSNIAYKITSHLGTRISETKIRGIVYSGGHDGHCAFVRNFSEVIPHSYSKDNGRTWIKAITDELIYRAGHDTDTEATLKNSVDVGGKRKFDDVANRSINGYVIVYKGGKSNYFEVATNKLISDVWFDFAANFDENGEAEVVYKKHKLSISKYEDGNFIVSDSDGAPLCYLNDLPNELNESKSDDFFKMILEEVLIEERKLIDNFDKVVNLMEFNSDDDFYFVQIIKRFKDNKDDDRSVGNYHAGAWYPFKGWRIHSVDELMQLKSTIINLCDANNARAYITVNNRSAKATDAQIVKIKKMYPKTDARHINADDIVPAQAKHGRNWRGQRPRFFIDVDTDDKKIWDEVRHMIQMCGITPLDEYETSSGGLHIIMPNKEDRNIQYLEHLFHKFDNWRDKGRLSLVHPNYDGKIILYSNVETKGY